MPGYSNIHPTYIFRSNYFCRCMLEHTKRQVHKWKFLQHALSRYVYNRSLFAIFTQVKNTSSHAHRTGSWYLLGFLYTNFNWRAPPLCSLNHLLARDCRSQTDLEILLKGLSRMITDVVWIKSELFYCEKSQRWTARKLYPIQCCLIANPCF